ncbi:MAG: T9SS type A sorting domain-containing protein, partial [Bacteroidia bacterium]
YFVAGYSQSFGGGDYDIYLIKIDPSGNLLWQKTYGGTGNEHAREIIHTSDGNYVLTGPSNSGQSSQQAFLMKIDLAGTVLWTKYYGGSGQETSNSVKQTPDGGFMMSGQTFSYGQSSGVVYLIKTDVNGDTTWTKYYNTGSLLSEAISLVSNGDGSFAFVVRDSTAASDIDVRIIKMDNTGNVIWNKNYGGSQKDTPKRLRNTNDGGYVASTTSRSFGWINPDMWILKFTSGGDTLWSKHFGGSNHEHGNDIKQMPDGGYIVVGHSKSYGPDGQRIMLVRINSAGTLGVKINDGEELSFNLYPNPSTDGALAIRYGKPATSSLKICNSLGQCVYSAALEFETNEAKTIRLTDPVPGVYIVSLQIDDHIATKKIIIE